MKNKETKLIPTNKTEIKTRVFCGSSGSFMFSSEFSPLRSILRGAGSILDLGATQYRRNRISSLQMSDSEALRQDWLQTGSDIAASISIIGGEIDAKK